MRTVYFRLLGGILGTEDCGWKGTGYRLFLDQLQQNEETELVIKIQTFIQQTFTALCQVLCCFQGRGGDNQR